MIRIDLLDIPRFCFTVASQPLYLLYLAVLVRYRHKEPFNSPFFRLSFAVGIFDICCWVQSNAVVTIPSWGVVNEEWFDALVQFTHLIVGDIDVGDFRSFKNAFCTLSIAIRPVEGVWHSFVRRSRLLRHVPVAHGYCTGNQQIHGTIYAAEAQDGAHFSLLVTLSFSRSLQLWCCKRQYICLFLCCSIAFVGAIPFGLAEPYHQKHYDNATDNMYYGFAARDLDALVSVLEHRLRRVRPFTVISVCRWTPCEFPVQSALLVHLPGHLPALVRYEAAVNKRARA